MIGVLFKCGPFTVWPSDMHLNILKLDLTLWSNPSGQTSRYAAALIRDFTGLNIHPLCRTRLQQLPAKVNKCLHITHVHTALLKEKHRYMYLNETLLTANTSRSLKSYLYNNKLKLCIN